jgi:hypothetical protein
MTEIDTAEFADLRTGTFTVHVKRPEDQTADIERTLAAAAAALADAKARRKEIVAEMAEDVKAKEDVVVALVAEWRDDLVPVDIAGVCAYDWKTNRKIVTDAATGATYGPFSITDADRQGTLPFPVPVPTQGEETNACPGCGKTVLSRYARPGGFCVFCFTDAARTRAEIEQ